MKTINIYLSKQQKALADKVRFKYKISLSTLCGKVSFYLLKALLDMNNQDMIQQLENKYIQEKGNYKTSVKPREVNEVLANEIKNKSIFTSNALIIYLNKDAKNYLDEKRLNQYYANIDKALNDAFDIYWDYNTSIRNQRRMIRQNKEYWKRVLEDA